MPTKDNRDKTLYILYLINVRVNYLSSLFRFLNNLLVTLNVKFTKDKLNSSNALIFVKDSSASSSSFLGAGIKN